LASAVAHWQGSTLAPAVDVIRTVASPEPSTAACRSFRASGHSTAILLVLELGDVQRVPSAKHLARYVGLTPTVRASADEVRAGHISKEGNRLVRWVLVIAATRAARRPGPLRAWCRGVERRKGRKIGRVALARRLAEIVYQAPRRPGAPGPPWPCRRSAASGAVQELRHRFSVVPALGSITASPRGGIHLPQ